MSTWRRRKQTRRKLRYCTACSGTGKVVTHVNVMTDAETLGPCRFCKGTGRKLDRETQRRANDMGYAHEPDCDCATCRINDSLGYDADVGDPSQYCKHGTFVGSWWGPDYICGKCEDGVDVCADCGIDLWPTSRFSDLTVGVGKFPPGYDYIGKNDTPGRYSETYGKMLCARCEDARNAVVADRFRLLDALAVAERVYPRGAQHLRVIASENVVEALALADKMGWVR